MTQRGGTLRGLLVGMLAILAMPASALAIDEFPITNPCPAGPGGGTCQPAGIAAGPDGALWFTEENGDRIGRITTAGAISEFSVTSGAHPTKITAGPDGRMWFTESGRNQIGAITTSGSVIEYPSTTAAPPDGITAGPDSALWFTEFNSNTNTGSRIGRMTTGGTITNEFNSNLPSGNGPGDITAGPDGRMWFTESNDSSGSSQVGAITTSGTITHIPLAPGNDPSGITASGAALFFTQFGANFIGRIDPFNGTVTNQFGAGSGQPSGIAVGSDGALWYTETGANKIGRITTGGTVTNEFAVPTANSQPGDIASGSDGALWFTEFVGNNIGRIAVAPPAPPPPPPPAPRAAPKATVKKCKVPKLRGFTIKKARKALKKARCRYKIRGKGRVKSTKPKAGTRTTKVVQVKAGKTRKKRR
jgi:virginiamycin B lyase